MADAIRKDQQNQDLSQEMLPIQHVNTNKVPVPQPQVTDTNARSVGRKSKAHSPLSQVESIEN